VLIWIKSVGICMAATQGVALHRKHAEPCRMQDIVLIHIKAPQQVT